MDVRGEGATVTGNCLHSSNSDDRPLLTVSGGNTVVSGNLLENIVLEINDATGGGKPILVYGNILDNSVIDRKEGNLVTSPALEQGNPH
jgi:hypothetical protein